MGETVKMKHGRNINSKDFYQILDSHTPSFRDTLFVIS